MADAMNPTRTEGTPKDYDYAHPPLDCDMVMKGGITSGIVYPLAVCEIAKTYRFRNIGGTSAGAIAAATVAAAELGRGKGGFQRLADLPRWLGKDENLFNLFQPQPRTRRLYAVLIAGIGAGGNPLTNIILAAARSFLPGTLLGAVPGLALGVLLVIGAHGLLLGWGIVCAALLALGGAAIGLGIQVYREARSAIPNNFFGLCSGVPGQDPRRAALTPWLTDQLDLLAGKAASPSDLLGTEPLTFGDLWRGPTPTQQPGEHAITLEMITTNLTQGRGYRLPFESHVWFFDPEEFAQLFPGRVVRWMVSHPPDPPAESARRRWELLCKLLEPLRPLPDAANLPVVVAARMSLSFPLLISAVPLWSIDWSRTRNEEAERDWDRWLRQQGDTWDSIRDDPDRWQDTPAQRLHPDRCWFSDGGITSNFPVHFFDAPIPRWPTFAINLRPFHPDHPEATENQCDNVWMPKTNEGGIEEWWVSIESLGGFIRSIFDTLQNGETNAQLHVPGYRDRIAHIELAESEGGMNLNMPPERIAKLSERGRCAGEKLSRRFNPPGDGTPLTWDNHRWIRYRSTMQLLQDALGMFYRAYTQPPSTGQTYAALIARGANVPPESYQWKGSQQQPAIQATAEIVNWKWGSSGPSFADGAPRPTPELRIKPRI